MSGARRSPMTILALGAGLLMAASIAAGAPEPGAAVVTSASSAAEECPSPRAHRGVHASRSLPQSGRRAVPPLKFPGFAASDRVALLPDVVPQAGRSRATTGRSRATGTFPALHGRSPLLTPMVWASPRLPWA
jgi:hypothetical protein